MKHQKKDLDFFVTKLTEKMPDPRNAKKHYQSFLRKKNTKSVEQSKIITQQPKTFKNPNTIDINSVIIYHLKTLHKLSKTIRQVKKVSKVGSSKGSNSPLYSETKKWKFFEQIEWKKQNAKYDTFYSHWKAETIINESDLDDIFKSIYTTIRSNIPKSLRKGLGWIINSAIEQNINISKYNPLAGTSCIKLPKDLQHPQKRLINTQDNDDNECFT